MIASRSRWLVGSSRSSRSEGHISACARLSRMRQPPEKLATGSATCSRENPSPWSSCSARGRTVYTPASPRAACSSPMRWPSSACSASASSASSRRSVVSPSMAYSSAGRSSAGVSCATYATRHCLGKSTSPLSECSSSRSKAKRLVLPEPFAPIRPMRSPGLSATSAPSSSTLVPRRRVTWERRIMTRRALYALARPQASEIRPLPGDDEGCAASASQLGQLAHPADDGIDHRDRLLGHQRVARVRNHDHAGARPDFLGDLVSHTARLEGVELTLQIEERRLAAGPPLRLFRCAPRLELCFVHLGMPPREPYARLVPRREERYAQIREPFLRRQLRIAGLPDGRGQLLRSLEARRIRFG